MRCALAIIIDGRSKAQVPSPSCALKGAASSSPLQKRRRSERLQGGEIHVDAIHPFLCRFVTCHWRSLRAATNTFEPPLAPRSWP